MYRILILDDDPHVRGVVRDLLVESGHHVEAAETGAVARILAAPPDWDLIVVDAKPAGDHDPIDVCARVKQASGFGAVPLLLFSHGSLEHMTGRAYDAGCDGVLGEARLPTIEKAVHALLRIKQRQNLLVEHLRRLQAELRARVERDGAGPSEHAEAEARLPDAVLLVDGAGRVLRTDRGAIEILGRDAQQRTLGALAPASGLEAFVRDAHSERQEGFRFDLGRRPGRAARSLTAAVLPACDRTASDDALRVVLLYDARRPPAAEESELGIDERIRRLQLAGLVEAARSMFHPRAFAGVSEEAQALRRELARLAGERGPVLIEGPSGCEKDGLSRILHYTGQATGPFLQIRCTGMGSESLVEQLFGAAGRPGLASLARDGSLAIHEIAATSPAVQARLLQALAPPAPGREAGGAFAQVRLIATSSVELARLVRQGRFHRGLYERLAMGHLRVPALAERKEDVLVIARRVLEQAAGRGVARGLSARTAEVLVEHEWPGDVAELRAAVELALRRARGAELRVQDLPGSLRALDPDPHDEGFELDLLEGLEELAPPIWTITDEDPIDLEHYERKVLLRAIDTCHGDKVAAAKLLNLGKSTLYRKLKRLGIP